MERSDYRVFGDWLSKTLLHDLVTESEMTPGVKKQHWSYVSGVCDKELSVLRDALAVDLLPNFINFILRQSTLALEILLQKFGLVEETSCSLFMFPLVRFQEFAE